MKKEGVILRHFQESPEKKKNQATFADSLGHIVNSHLLAILLDFFY